MRITRYPLSQTTTPLELMAALLTDASGNSGNRLTNVPTGPDGAPLKVVGLVPIDINGNFVDITGNPVSASVFGMSTANSAADNTTAMNALIAALGDGAQPTMVKFAPGVYNMGLISIEKSNIVFDLRGVTFTGPACRFVTSPAAQRVGIIGPAKLINTGGSLEPVLHMNGLLNFAFPLVHIEKAPEAGGYMAMFEYDATNGHVTADLIIRGGNGVFIEGVGHRINVDAIGLAAGADDCIAFKARNIATRNCIVTGSVSGYASAVAFGSEIGTLGVDAPLRPGKVINNIVNLVAENCVYPLFMKPGAIDAGASYDWRYGLVAHNKISIQAMDLVGTNFQRAVMSASRAAMVRNNDVFISFEGRASTAGGVPKHLFHFYIPDYSAAVPPAAAPTIRDNVVKLYHYDIYDGVANGVGGAPGAPITSVVSMEKGAVGHGTFASNVVEIEAANGTSNYGVYVGPGCSNGLHVRRVNKARSINVVGGAANGGGIVADGSTMTVGTEININMLTGHPYRITAGGDINCPEMGEDAYLWANAAAGAGETQYPWYAGKRMQLTELRLMTTNAVVASDVDYTNLQFTGNAGTVFLTPKTKATGPANNARNFVLSGIASSVIYHLSDLNPAVDAALIDQTLFAADTRLKVVKADTGAGKALTNARLYVKALPY